MVVHTYLTSYFIIDNSHSVLSIYFKLFVHFCKYRHIQNRSIFCFSFSLKYECLHYTSENQQCGHYDDDLILFSPHNMWGIIDSLFKIMSPCPINHSE